MKVSRIVPAAALCLVVGAGCGHKPDTYEDDTPDVVESWWAGAVSLPGAQQLELQVHFVPNEDGSVSGTISIPAQAVTDAPLVDVSDDGSQLAFTLQVPGAPAVFTATRTADGQAADGTLSQGGAQLPLHLAQTTPEAVAAAGPARPQTPAPPFPYAARDATWQNADDNVTLAGTLTFPDDGAKHPAVLLITGSGQQDRDETIFGHKPFWVLADALTRRGFAVLRVDDRGVGGSTAGAAPVTLRSNLGDALASVAWLAAQPEVDPTRVGLVGHSEGGILVAMAAAEHPDRFAFIVSLAGTGIRGDALITLQVGAVGRAEGASEEQVEANMAEQRALLQLVAEGADEATLKAALEAAFDAGLAKASDEEKAEVEKIGKEALVTQRLAQLGSPWLRSFLAFDPTEAWRQVRCPVLVVIGEKDRQVPPEENLAGIRAALTAGGNPDFTLETLPGLNHLFQTAGTGGPSEYVKIEETFAPSALARIGDWLEAKASVAVPGDGASH
ncbi:MAG: alpha/beta fold hydrolase [Deltaproteobacteria bacterium]|nr:MAG: alpha/beta fold hydrolase [Deltaproteobacteria bacterium]